MRRGHKMIPTNIKGFCEFELEAGALLLLDFCAVRNTFIQHSICQQLSVVNGSVPYWCKVSQWQSCGFAPFPTRPLKWKSISGRKRCDQRVWSSALQPCPKALAECLRFEGEFIERRSASALCGRGGSLPDTGSVQKRKRPSVERSRSDLLDLLIKGQRSRWIISTSSVRMEMRENKATQLTSLEQIWSLHFHDTPTPNSSHSSPHPNTSEIPNGRVDVYSTTSNCSAFTGHPQSSSRAGLSQGHFLPKENVPFGIQCNITST